MITIDYSKYSSSIQELIRTNNLTNFKTNPAYTEILEHVNYRDGYEYLSAIKENTTLTKGDIVRFCELNDSYGNPKQERYDDLVTSPTSLRYIWHAHIILSYFKKFNRQSYDLVELGGGYGGLCLAISFFAKLYDVTLSRYSIIDLNEASELQAIYLSKFPIPFQVDYISADTFGKNIEGNDLFFISNYCFSEISTEYQKKYIETLFPKVLHGFLAWNMIPLYNFGFPIYVEDETPKTGEFNKFVYF